MLRVALALMLTAVATAPSPVATAPVDAAALETLLTQAEAGRSGALLVTRCDATVVERHWGRSPDAAYPMMSVTKSITSLAIGCLLQDGRIRSVDQPLSTWFPSWRRGLKAQVTLRHVLTHTSGLHHEHYTHHLYAQPDWLRYALSLPLDEAPGSAFAYNNEAMVLLGGVVRQAAGEPIDRYLDRRLFRPLGITGWRWNRDKAGNLDTFGGLSLRARDLAAIGRLMLAEGVWRGRRLLPAAYLLAATSPYAPGHNYGYLWWLRNSGRQTAEGLARLQAAGFEPAPKLAPLNDQPITSGTRYLASVRTLLSAPEFEAFQSLLKAGTRPIELVPDHQAGYMAIGDLGQHLVVLPRLGVVAVRLRAYPDDARDYEVDAYDFRDFPQLVPPLFDPPEPAASQTP